MAQALAQAPSKPQGIQNVNKHLTKALGVLNTFEVKEAGEAPKELIRLLDKVKHLGEDKVLAIANTVHYMGKFNALIREKLESIDVSEQYVEINEIFESIRQDSKRLVDSLEKNQTIKDKVSNAWMNWRRGNPSVRFSKVVEIFNKVCADTQDQLKKEGAVMDCYTDFRYALKESQILAYEIFQQQTAARDKAEQAYKAAQTKVEEFQGDASAKSKLELERDILRDKFYDEDSMYQLTKDIYENLTNGYNIGEALVVKLKQTHDTKTQVYRKSVTFFTTNEHVFTTLGAVYTSQSGLNSIVKAVESMQEGANKGIEDVASLGTKIQLEGIRVGYGDSINPASIEKLVQSISDYEEQSSALIADLRQQASANVKSINDIMEEGKRQLNRIADAR